MTRGYGPRDGVNAWSEEARDMLSPSRGHSRKVAVTSDSRARNCVSTAEAPVWRPPQHTRLDDGRTDGRTRRPSNGAAGRRTSPHRQQRSLEGQEDARPGSRPHTRPHAPTLTCAAVRRDGPLRLRAAPAGAPRQGLRAGLHEVHDVHPADLGETAHKAGVCGIREKALVACEGAFLKIFQLAALLKF